MKVTKIFYGNQHIDNIYCGKTKMQVFRYKAKRLAVRVVFVIIAMDIIGWSGVAGYHYAKKNIVPEIVEAEVIKEVMIESDAPVMARIFKCESGGKHLGKNGQIIIGVNTNGTVDIGIAQINTVNFAQATKLGFDITKEKDNIAFAKWLYANRGSEPWYSSKGCWNR